MSKSKADWINYYMRQAKCGAEGSKDESSKVGCRIITKDFMPVSEGYNGYVRGCDEEFMSQKRPMKYHLTLHAEINAIHFSGRSRLDDCIAISTHGPCDNCLLNLAQKGIREVYYEDSGIMRKRGTSDQLLAIYLIMKSNNMTVKNSETGIDYIDDLDMSVFLDQNGEYMITRKGNDK